METCFSAPAGMARANHEIKDKESGIAQSSTSLSMPSISASRPCPYLGFRKNPGISFDRPSRGNICFGKERVKLKLFRRVNVPYTAVSRSKQADLCLGSFSDCPIFIEKSKKNAPPSTGLPNSSESSRTPPARKIGTLLKAVEKVNAFRPGSPTADCPGAGRWRCR